jgi:hypothetical protein
VGEIETIRRGFFVTVTFPLAVTIVTGKAVGVGRGAEAPELTGTRAAAAIPTATRNERST